MIFYNRNIILIRPKMWLANGMLTPGLWIGPCFGWTAADVALIRRELPRNATLYPVATTAGSRRLLSRVDCWQDNRAVQSSFRRCSYQHERYMLGIGDLRRIVHSEWVCIEDSTMNWMLMLCSPHIPYGLAGEDFFKLRLCASC